MPDPPDHPDLRTVLADAQDRGFVGGDLDVHIEHSLGFWRAAGHEAAAPARAIDLGSGGGIPGLVLAAAYPETSWVLVDAQLRRTDWLSEAIVRLGLGDRVQVVHRRAEDLGRDPGFRAASDLVVSRSFGPPAVVAECGAPLLRAGGLLVVSEPMDAPRSAGARWDDVRWDDVRWDDVRWDDVRWDDTALDLLGLVRRPSPHPAFAVLEQADPCPDRFPRRAGRPARNPLF